MSEGWYSPAFFCHKDAGVVTRPLSSGLADYWSLSRNSDSKGYFVSALDYFLQLDGWKVVFKGDGYVVEAQPKKFKPNSLEVLSACQYFERTGESRVWPSLNGEYRVRGDGA